MSRRSTSDNMHRRIELVRSKIDTVYTPTETLITRNGRRIRKINAVKRDLINIERGNLGGVHALLLDDLKTKVNLMNINRRSITPSKKMQGLEMYFKNLLASTRKLSAELLTVQLKHLREEYTNSVVSTKLKSFNKRIDQIVTYRNKLNTIYHTVNRAHTAQNVRNLNGLRRLGETLDSEIDSIRHGIENMEEKVRNKNNRYTMFANVSNDEMNAHRSRYVNANRRIQNYKYYNNNLLQNNENKARTHREIAESYIGSGGGWNGGNNPRKLRDPSPFAMF